LLVNQQLQTKNCVAMILFIAGAVRQRIDKVQGENHERIEPVCKFGPGGDFVTDWPGSGQKLGANEPNAIARLLATLGAIINNMVGCEFQPNSFASQAELVREKRFPSYKKTVESSTKRGYFDNSDAPMRGLSKSANRGASSQPRLFSDDWTTRSKAGHKPKHHVRAYQRTSRKRPAAIASDQGMLFEIDRKSARIA